MRFFGTAEKPRYKKLIAYLYQLSDLLPSEKVKSQKKVHIRRSRKVLPFFILFLSCAMAEVF